MLVIQPSYVSFSSNSCTDELASFFITFPIGEVVSAADYQISVKEDIKNIRPPIPVMRA